MIYMLVVDCCSSSFYATLHFFFFLFSVFFCSFVHALGLATTHAFIVRKVDITCFTCSGINFMSFNRFSKSESKIEWRRRKSKENAQQHLFIPSSPPPSFSLPSFFFFLHWVWIVVRMDRMPVFFPLCSLWIFSVLFVFHRAPRSLQSVIRWIFISYDFALQMQSL